MSPTPNHDEQLFSDALARPENERAAFLDQACAGDPERRARLESFLRADERAKSFLETVPASVERTALIPASPEEKPGDHIGHYKLLQKLGEGGCGVVWMAEQELIAAARNLQAEANLGGAFLEEYERWEEPVRRFPDSCPEIARDIRCGFLRRFKYPVTYTVRGETLRVLYVRHARRTPLTAWPRS